MASKAKKKKKGRAGDIDPKVRCFDEESRLNYLAVLPALILIAATMMQLLMAVSMPTMKNSQFSSYSDLFRMGFWLSFIAGAVFLIAYAWIYVRSGAGRLKEPGFLRKQIHWAFFALFAIWILLSTAINGIDKAALHGIPYRNQGFLHVIFYLAVLCLVSSFVKTPGLRRATAAGYLITADLTALATIAFLAGAPIEAFSGKKGLCAIFFNGNHYGYFLVMAVLLAAGMWISEEDRKWSVFSGLSLVLDMAVLFINDSLGCLLAVAAVLFVTAIVISVRERHVDLRSLVTLGIFMVIPLLGACVLSIRGSGGFDIVSGNITELFEDIRTLFSGSIPASAGHNRWGLWALTAQYISDRPLFGYGCEGISEMLQTATGRSNVHNELLCYAAFYGIPAAVFYTAGVISALIGSVAGDMRRKDSLPFIMAAAGYFLSSLVGVSMFYTTPFFFIFLGYSLAEE